MCLQSVHPALPLCYHAKNRVTRTVRVGGLGGEENENTFFTVDHL